LFGSRAKVPTLDLLGLAKSDSLAAQVRARRAGPLFAAMTSSLRDLVGQVDTTASSLGSAPRQMASTSDEARRVADEGVEAAEQANDAMRAVAVSSEQVGDAIQELSARSQQIGGILDTITGIAEQTNLLAAARRGLRPIVRAP
jgi:methyl-accepting chemotaxis protein